MNCVVQLTDTCRRWPPPPGAEKPVVLVVDCDELSANATGSVFRHAGAEPVVCLDGWDAVESALGPSVALVCLTLSMPLLSGAETLGLIRANERSRLVLGAPVMALADALSPQSRAMSVAAGFFGHCARPVDLQAVTSALEKSLRLRHSLAIARNSVDLSSITEMLEQTLAEKTTDRRGAVLALAKRAHKLGIASIYAMALGVFRGSTGKTVDAAHELRALAQSLGARHLADLASGFICGINGRVETLEDVLVLARAELDRVVLTCQLRAAEMPAMAA